MTDKTCDIFIKSYRNDFKLLNYALLSIAKYLTGYRKVILLIPSKDIKLFSEQVNVPDSLSIDVHFVDEQGNGYLAQQWYKLSAYKYSDANYILFGDSDCIVHYEQNLQDYIKDGKPEILYTDWDKVGDAVTWRKPTETIMGELVKWEFMRRNFLLYHRSTLENIGKWQPNLESIVMGADRFSEFNLMGAYAFKNEPDNYSFVNTDKWNYTEPKSIQLWSHFSNGDSTTHKDEKQRAIDTINKALGLNITEI